MSTFPTDDEREVVQRAHDWSWSDELECSESVPAVLTARAPLIRAREAAAWEAGANAAWGRSTRHVNGQGYAWHSTRVPNPYR